MGFKKSALNKKYELACPPETVVHVPVRETHGAYSGQIGDIADTAILDGMIARGSNLLSLKKAPQKEDPPPPAADEQDNQNEQ